MCEISEQVPERPGPLTTLSVFVYGTLKPGGRYHRRYCETYLTEAIPALVKGRLYDFPALGYPGMTAGEDWVKGYLLKFVQDKAICREILQRLDHLEGYREDLSAEMNDYQRVSVQVFTLAHEPLPLAWVYQMTAAAVHVNNGRYLPKGNW